VLLLEPGSHDEEAIASCCSLILLSVKNASSNSIMIATDWWLPCDVMSDYEEREANGDASV
jgi:hypothetical protein